MKEEYLNKINTIKEMLDALPKNNERNKKKFKDILLDNINTLNEDKNILLSEIKKRNEGYNSVSLNDHILLLNESLGDAIKNLILSNPFASSMQKSGLDKVLYNLCHYYTIDFESVNKNIKDTLDIFNKVGIELTSEYFNYSYYTNKYMTDLLSNKEDLKSTFETIYWKCPDIIKHITLNFKYLYYLNEKKFDNYYKSIDNDVVFKYKEIVSELEIETREDKYILLNDLLSGKLNISDFKSDKIKSLSLTFSNNECTSEDLINLSHSLIEYKWYESIKYIVEDIINKYNEKDKYKGLYNKTKKNIQKKEKTLFKENKKIVKYISKNKLSKVDYLNNIINNNLSELDVLYEELETNYFLEQLLKLNDESRIKDILLLAVSNFNYLIELFKSKELEYDKEYDILFKLTYNPYSTIIDNVWIKDEKDISLIIIDKYNLYGYMLTKDMLNLENIDSLINNVNLLITSYYVNKFNITEERINFMKDAKNLIN